MANIRAPHTLHELNIMATMAAAMCFESPRYSVRTISADRILETLKLLDKAGAFLRVYEDEDGISGIMVGSVAPYLCGPEFYACDLILYVKPEKRGTRAAITLVKEFEKWATDLGVAEVMLGTSTGIAAEKTACLYQRLGYSPVSKGFSKGV